MRIYKTCKEESMKIKTITWGSNWRNWGRVSFRSTKKLFNLNPSTISYFVFYFFGNSNVPIPREQAAAESGGIRPKTMRWLLPPPVIPLYLPVPCKNFVILSVPTRLVCVTTMSPSGSMSLTKPVSVILSPITCITVMTWKVQLSKTLFS